MSCWWDLDFSVTGPEPLIEELRTTLPDLKFDDGAPLFHHIEIRNSIAGFVVLHTCRNYQGVDAICELIARFPELAFQGPLHSDVGYDQYTTFQGRDGETEFREMVISAEVNRTGEDAFKPVDEPAVMLPITRQTEFFENFGP